MRIFSHTEDGYEHINEDVVFVGQHTRDEDSVTMICVGGIP